MDVVPVAREPESVHGSGKGHAQNKSDEDTQEKGLSAPVEGDASGAEDEEFAEPDQEDGEDGAPHRAGFHNGEPDRMEGPPGETVTQESK